MDAAYQKTIDISIPLKFNGPQPNAYGVEPATAETCEYGELIGDTRRGGSCNFERYTFIPHCNGTHTECVGHITDERISIRDCLRDVLMDAVLISVDPSGPSNFSLMSDDDQIIPAEDIENAIMSANLSLLDSDRALIVRTLPNTDEKLTREYGTDHAGAVKIPPYFTEDAMRYIVECCFTHLLCDLPSFERIHNDGEHFSHRILWYDEN